MFDNWEAYSGVVAATIAAGISTIGLLTIVFVGDWGRRNSPQFSAFAVGFLGIAITCHLFPEAWEKDANAPLWFVAGVFAIAILAQAVRVLTSQRVEGRDLALGYASLFAVGAHSFIDGLFYETAFSLGDVTGWISIAGLLFHEMPEAVIAYFLARETGISRVSAWLYAFFAASLTTVFGALTAMALLDSAVDLRPGLLMALTAGGLTYIAVFHLGPHALLSRKGKGYQWLSIGISISLAAVVFSQIFDVH